MCGECFKAGRTLSTVPQMLSEAVPSGSASAAPSNYPSRNVIAGIFLLLIIGSLGFVHIVSTGSGVTIIPKTHFTFASTFVSTDDILERYNHRSLRDAFSRDELFDNLVRELEHRGYITSHKRTWKEIEDETRRNLPDQ